MISSTTCIPPKGVDVDVRCWMQQKNVSYINFLYLMTTLRSVIYETKSAWVTVVFFHFSQQLLFLSIFSFKAEKRGWKQITAEIVAAKRTFVSIWKIGAAQQQQRWQRTWSEIGSAKWWWWWCCCCWWCWWWWWQGTMRSRRRRSCAQNRDSLSSSSAKRLPTDH